MDSDEYDSDIETGVRSIVCIPECDEALKPYIGRAFKTMDECVAFYRAYGSACGFGTRKSTTKRDRFDFVRLRYLLCMRAGKHNFGSHENLESGGKAKRKRRTSSCRIECPAMVCVRFQAGVGYVVYKFNEYHNHQMVSNGYRPLMKVNKKVDLGHHMFLARCAKANVGASRSFHIFKQLVGDYVNVRVRKNDFKNIYRDIKCKIDGLDTEMVLKKFSLMSQKNIDFFYKHFEDEDKDLTRLFWADRAAIQNYKIFGDAVSFDATYSTNKYCMVFTPFTGKDNHGKCVNFGAGLLSHENAESYGWLLSKFVECMGSAPKMLITDQDRGIKAAVEIVMPNTRHRFCMWHIMSKLGDKVPHSLRDDDGFTQQFTELVWSDLYSPTEFEIKWQSIMDQFNLHGNKWFQSMYELRTSWIPAYFQDVPMSGLFRTTSLSESENGFFRKYMNRHANLCEFYMHFETAMETQRHDHDSRTLVDQTSSPAMITRLQIERHAASIYTNEIFIDVQKEIEMAVMFCSIQNKYTTDDVVTYDVDEDAIGTFKVVHDFNDDFLKCSCNFFIMHGMVCRHMYSVMKVLKIQHIGDRYIVNRWTKSACSIFDEVGQNIYAAGGVQESPNSDGMFALACKCVGLASCNEEIAMELKTILSDFYEKNSVMVDPLDSNNGKLKAIEQYYGMNIPDEAHIGEPKTSKTKGSCSRLISRKEAAIKRLEKPKRLCRKCQTWGHHDSRNCSKVNNNLASN